MSTDLSLDLSGGGGNDDGGSDDLEALLTSAATTDPANPNPAAPTPTQIPVVDTAAIAERERMIAERERQLADRERALQNTVPGASQTTAPPQAPAVDPAAAAAHFNELFLRDPGQAFLQVYDLARRDAESAAIDRFRRENAGTTAATGEAVLANYRASQNLDAVALQEFNEMASQQGLAATLAQMPAAARTTTLDLLRDAAEGRASRKRAASAAAAANDGRQLATPRGNIPPTIPVGDAVTRALSNPNEKFRGKKLNAAQREILASISRGDTGGVTFTPQQIASMLDDAAGEE